MTSPVTSAVSQFASFVRGVTLVCGDADTPLPPGATSISHDPGAVSAWGDASVDSVVALSGLDEARDPIQTLRAWRRVLKEDGSLVLGHVSAAGGLSPSFVLSIVQSVGGFECVAEGSTPLVLVRRRVAEIRVPLAVLGPALAAAASDSVSCRIELLFQMGTVLLQCGESGLARNCFEQVLRQEPGSAEGHFGLGMAHGSEQRWRDALCELECARRLDPDNAEVHRWLGLARGHVGVGVGAVVTLPAAVPAKWSPAPTPTPTPTSASAAFSTSLGRSLRL